MCQRPFTKTRCVVGKLNAHLGGLLLLLLLQVCEQRVRVVVSRCPGRRRVVRADVRRRLRCRRSVLHSQPTPPPRRFLSRPRQPLPPLCSHVRPHARCPWRPYRCRRGRVRLLLLLLFQREVQQKVVHDLGRRRAALEAKRVRRARQGENGEGGNERGGERARKARRESARMGKGEKGEEGKEGGGERARWVMMRMVSSRASSSLSLL